MNENSRNIITTEELSDNIIINSGNNTIIIDDAVISFNLESGKLHFLNR